MSKKKKRYRKKLRLKNAIKSFLATYDNPATQRSYKAALKTLRRFLGNPRLSRITDDDLVAWRNHLPDHLSPATLNNRTKAVKRFFNWCVKERSYLKRSPARFLKIQRIQPRTTSKAIPIRILAAMYEHVQGKHCHFIATRDTAILSLMITYGARAGDVSRLLTSQIYFQQGKIGFVVKGGRYWELPLPNETARVLRTWLNVRAALPDLSHDYVFVNIRQSHGRLKSISISKLVERLSEFVCGKRYGPHSIRHWRGQSLADAGVNPKVAQAIMMHEDVQTTMDFYYNQDDRRVKWVLDQFEVGQMFATLELEQTFIPFPFALPKAVVGLDETLPYRQVSS